MNSLVVNNSVSRLLERWRQNPNSYSSMSRFPVLIRSSEGRLASEVRTILKSDGICSLLVTHDQREAFDFADRIAVMHQGHICQFDTPF
jgi:hypothetical protein